MIARTAVLLALSSLAAPASADLELSWSEGVLGFALHYELEGEPGEFYAWIPSFEEGPICLCLFDPLDPRSLLIGFDLLTLTQTGLLDASGEATQTLPLPAAPGLSGLTLRMQAMTFPGNPTQVDDVSNVAKLVLSFPAESHDTPGEMTEARRYASVTTLADGRAFVGGGMSLDVPSIPLATAELFDPDLQEFHPTATPMPAARARHSQTLLEDGRLLLAGGVDSNGVVVSTAVIYDPDTDSFVQAASMDTPRVLHSATRLANGSVLVIGGAASFDLSHPVGFPDIVIGAVTATSEIYDPGTNTWSDGATLRHPLLAHSAVRLGDDRVLVAGGVEVDPLATAETTDASWLFSSTGANASPTAALPAARFHMGSSPLFASNGAIVSGGTLVDFSTLATTVHVETWVFDAAAELWNDGPDLPAGTRCGDLGCVGFVKTLTVPSPICPVPPCEITCNVYIIGGGWDDLQMSPLPGTPNTDIYELDAALTQWTPVTTTATRPGMTMAPIDDGLRFLVIGSSDVGAGQPDKTAELVVPIL